MKDLKEKNNKYLMNTYGKYSLQIEKGKGAICWDFHGKKHIDFTSGIGVNSLGFCNDFWIDAVVEQAKKLQHTSNLYYTSPVIELAEELCEKTGYDKSFFCNSGAEANEGAIKIARKYSFDKYGEGRYKIITFNNSFHGRTITTLSATGQECFHKFFDPFTEGFCYADVNNIESVMKLLDGTVCAVMLEFVQGEGGVNNLSKFFVEKLVALCKKHDILVIADEVQTGIGRTGKLLASMDYSVVPDITTLAKGLGGGLPIGAILTQANCSNVLNAGQHGTTFGGNPVVCAGALACFKKICDDDFLQEVQEKATFIRGELLKMHNVKDVSGKGLMIGVTLENISATECAVNCLNNGLLVLTAKEKIRLLPPLNITYDELGEGLSILKEVLSKRR